MNTPILDFIDNYNNSNLARLHMPGHKGKSQLGVENFDITEINGADALFIAEGIIGESEANATRLFDSLRTCYSTEGSSQCVRAMLTMAALLKKHKSPLFVAGRNAHKAFIYGAAMLDADVLWMYPEKSEGVCGCYISPESLEKVLSANEDRVTAVYLTSPDYLGNMQDIERLAEICHAHNTLLLVDNAHGAYLHFLDEPKHPLDLGADMCSDSAHKTFSVVTGGAYLHINKSAPKGLIDLAKPAMEMYGSTSPSYITLASLDNFNNILANNYRWQLAQTINRISETKAALVKQGLRLVESDPLKITIEAPAGHTGESLAKMLRKQGGEPEYADVDYLVLMLTPDNDENDYRVVEDAFAEINASYEGVKKLYLPENRKAVSIREAVFAPQLTLDVEEAVGRVCASPVVACPPAIPIVVSGEIISSLAVQVMKDFGIEKINVIE